MSLKELHDMGSQGPGKKIVREDIHTKFRKYFKKQRGQTYRGTGSYGTPYKIWDFGDVINIHNPPIVGTVIYYNEECFLYAVLNGMRENCSEFIIIDGRYQGFNLDDPNHLSTDRSDEYIKEFFMDFGIAGFPFRVRWIKPKTVWHSQTEKRNIQFDLTDEGTWILAMDADEIILQTSWEQFWQEEPLKQTKHWFIFVKFLEVFDGMKEHWHWRFLKNVNGIHYDRNHWTLYNRNNEKMRANQTEAFTTLPYFKLAHLTWARSKERYQQKVAHLAWKQKEGIDVPDDWFNPPPEPEDLVQLDPEKITSSWLSKKRKEIVWNGKR